MGEVAGRALGLRLCEVLGLNPHLVKSVTIHADADDPVIVTVRQLVMESNVLTDVFTDYSLVEKT